MKRIVFTVTTGLDFDQRMIRICNTLTETGYSITLTGVSRSSKKIKPQKFAQKKLRVFFKKGFAFYVEYNIRLFFYLLFNRHDVICCIDLDTIIPVYYISKLRNKTRIYDAHEYFSQLKEVVTRPRVYRFWHSIERHFVPKFPAGYTVSQAIADDFKALYGVDYGVIRNMPLLADFKITENANKILLYQGSVNEARGFEYLIPAMKQISAILHICGKGNFLAQAQKLVSDHDLHHKVFFLGEIAPEQLLAITRTATIGINLVEPVGLNQKYSLANKFFDYVHACIPQITMNFPEYSRINQDCRVALLLDELSADTISHSASELLNNRQLYDELQQNCMQARQKYNWQAEESKLIFFYQNVMLNCEKPKNVNH